METNNDQTQQAVELTQNMLTATSPTGVLSQPIQKGETTVITASEVTAAMGVGQAAVANGGGGTTHGRPVAVVSIDSQGDVVVTPIVDVTKIGLTFVAALSSFLVLLSKMKN